MNANDLELLLSVDSPAVSPDGTRAIVAVSHPSFAADSDVGQLWEVRLDDGSARRLTRGSEDFSPRFSPDGTAIAFLRAGDGAPQLQALDARGGEPVAVTDQKLGVGDFAWTPDSRSLVYTARVAEEGRYGTVDGLGPGAEPARRFTTLVYKANGLGFTTDRRAQLFTVDAPPVDGEPVYERAPEVGDAPKPEKVPTSRQLTAAEADHGSPSVTADGANVVFVAALHDSRDDDLRADVWMLPLNATPETAPTRLTGDEMLGVEAAAAGPDGRIWFLAQQLGDDGLDFVGRNGAIYLIDGSEVTRLTDPAEHDFIGMGAAITVESASSVLVQDSMGGRTPLYRIRDDGSLEQLTTGDVEVGAHDVAGGVLVVTVQTPESFGEVARVDDSGLRLLTDFGAPLKSRGLTMPIELTVTARDGYPVHGWVAIPSGSSAGEGPHPTLLMIHGGPYTQYSVHLFDETQVYADAGYAVVYCNPRGSSGYGEEHGRAIKDAMGTLDYTDVLDFLDGAIAAHPELDGDRVGILGGSYGGYLTAWTIAHDHRFAGAIVERGYLDPEFFIGTSDIGSFFSQGYTGQDVAHRATQSPQAVVDQVSTPTLVLHSELDLRCPVSQAERYYASLKRNGVPTELVLFPGENHELSRGGRPRHRRQRFEIILDWWHRYLPVTAAGGA